MPPSRCSLPPGPVEVTTALCHSRSSLRVTRSHNTRLGSPQNSPFLGKLRQRGRSVPPEGRGARAGESKQDFFLLACGRGLLCAGSAALLLLCLPGDRARVPAGATPSPWRWRAGRLFLPLLALCAAGLAPRTARPWPPARCRALLQRQLPLWARLGCRPCRGLGRGRTLLPGSPPGTVATPLS